MKLKNILKTTGALHILLGLLIIFLLIFSVETIAGKASTETLLLVRGTADVVAASNLGIGFLLIICSSIKDKKSLKKVLSGELALMACLLAVALFNTFNAGTIVDGGPPPPFWVVLIVNPISKKNEIPQDKIEFFISKALIKAEKQGFSGKELTPFLLETIRKETKGDSLKANISLAKSNVRLGAKIAHELSLCVNMTTN